MPTLVVDGYNVIHAVPELTRQMDRSLQAAREALVRRCEAYRAQRGDIERVYVVFDGRGAEGAGGSGGRQGRVTVCFTRPPEEADQRILRLIESERPRRCVVVSDDNEVANNARAFGARLLSVREFARPVRPAKAPHAASRSAEEKPTLPPLEAQRITDAYRRHLEDAARRRRAT